MHRLIVSIVALALTVMPGKGIFAQEVPRPPALGTTIVDSPLTSEELFRPISCPTGQGSATFGSDGFRLSLAGPCGTNEDYAALPLTASNVTFPDGDVRVKFRVTEGIDKAQLGLDVRLQAGGWYRLAWQPASGMAYLAAYPSGKETILTQSTTVAKEASTDKVHTMALRAQGSQLWGLIDDAPILMASDAAFSAGAVGFDLLRTGPASDTQRVTVLAQGLQVSALAGSAPDRAPSVKTAGPTQSGPAVDRSTASGSCGPAPGSYGLTGLSAEMFGIGARTVPAIYYQVDYAVQYPTTLGLLVRYNDEIGGIEFILDTWGTPSTRGSHEGAWHADIRPEDQGEGDGYTISSGKYDGPANSQWLSRLQSGYSGRGGIFPGGWTFSVYAGEWKLHGDTWKFDVDMSGPLGKFGCNVADDEAKN